MRIFESQDVCQIRALFDRIHADPYGSAIMAPKAATVLIHLPALSNMCANILKQEMLSLGADAAVSRNALTGKDKKTDCILMGTYAQFARLCEKLVRQPFGLNALGSEIAARLKNYQKNNFILHLGSRRLRLGRRTHIMGIVNITPDSFSGDGLYGSRLSSIVSRAVALVQAGADSIDVGGESSRPGARAVTVKEELSRTIPAIRRIAAAVKVPVSVDTTKPEVAAAALKSGAVMVNDISGGADERMLGVVRRHNAALVLMHMKGKPRTMQKAPQYASLIEEIIQYLEKAVRRALDAGIAREKIIVDPGIGFGKTLEHNLEIINRLRDFKIIGRPIMIGTSRKSFIGTLLDRPAQERINGTIASCCAAVANGAHIVRVHDVGPVRQALKVVDSIHTQCRL